MSEPPEYFSGMRIGIMYGILMAVFVGSFKPEPLRNELPPYIRSRAIRIEPRVNILFRTSPSHFVPPQPTALKLATL